MIHYLILFATTTLLGFLIKGHGGKALNKRERHIYYLIFAILFIYVGCRDVSVGSDSSVYQYKFDTAHYYSLFEFLSLNLFSDPGFYTFTWLIRHLTSSVNLYFMIISAVYFSTFLIFIKKYSTNIGFSIWLLNALGFTTFAMSTLRQSLAMAFCLMCYMLYAENKKKLCVLPLLIAISFHSTSIAFLPMLFVNKFVNSKQPWIIILIMGATVLFAPILKLFLFTNIADGFYENTQVGGTGMIMLLLFIIGIGYFVLFPKRTGQNTIYFEFIAICMAFCMFIVTRFNLAAMRLFLYYLAFAVVYIPRVVDLYKPSVKTLLYVVLSLLTFYYLVTRVMASPYEESRLLLPYSFFWEL